MKSKKGLVVKSVYLEQPCNGQVISPTNHFQAMEANYLQKASDRKKNMFECVKIESVIVSGTVSSKINTGVENVLIIMASIK